MNRQYKPLKKIVYGMTETTLAKVIESHQDRGWIQSSEIKEHGYGLGCLMTFTKNN
ncbi:MAG: hypothetical protein ACQEWF_01815 [Bacillota bacterium]